MIVSVGLYGTFSEISPLAITELLLIPDLQYFHFLVCSYGFPPICSCGLVAALITSEAPAELRSNRVPSIPRPRTLQSEDPSPALK